MTYSTYQDRIENWHLSGLLDRAAEIYGDRPFIVGPTFLTYNEAACQTRKIAAWLRKAGLSRGDRVMIITKNCAEVALMAFAVARLGGIFTVINNLIKPYGLQQIFKQCEPAVVILDETTLELESVIDGAMVIWAGKVSDDCRQFEDLLKEPDPGKQIFPGIDLDPVCLIFTSGSTGSPRGVIISHDNIRFSTAAIQERLGYQPDDVVGLFLPLSFDYGLYQIFLTVAAGASIYIGGPELVGPELISHLALYKISVLPGVPTILAAMFKLLARRYQPLPHLRSITNTGQQLPLQYIEKIRQQFPQVQVFVMYGLTECKRVSILLPEEWEKKPESVGRPLAGTEVYLVGEDGKTLPPGAIGELVVRGRHVTLGYWQANPENQQRFCQENGAANRELYTGDLCRIDADGFIYFVGRNDDQLKHKGFRINPLEIEAVACSIKEVLEAGVVQSKDPDCLHLFMTVNQPEATTKDVFEVLQERLEIFKIPEKLYILSELPKTVNGKLDRQQLRKLIK